MWYFSWILTFLVVAVYAVTLAVISPFLGSDFRWNRRQLLLLVPLAVPFWILVWADELPYSATLQPTSIPTWPVHLLEALLVVQLLVSVWIVWALKGCRGFAAFTVSLELFLGVALAILVSTVI